MNRQGRRLVVIIASTGVIFIVLGLTLGRYLAENLAPRLTAVPQGVSAWELKGLDVFLVREGDEVVALLKDAHHRPGEQVVWCATPGVFVARHGENFDVRGRYLAGPASRDLDRVAATIEDARVVVDRDSIERSPGRTSGSPPPGYAPVPSPDDAACGSPVK